MTARTPRKTAESVETKATADRPRTVHLLVIPAPEGAGVLNMEAFTGENAARRELDNRIDAGWRYLALVPGEPYRPLTGEAAQA